MAAAATTLAIGAILGVLMGIYLKGWLPSLSDTLFLTHPTTMVVGYLVLAGMALSEWRLDPESAQKRASKAGWAQVILPFIGGVIITFGALANDPMLIGLYIPFQVIGIIIYLVRLGPKMLAVRWLAGGPGRHYAISAFFLVANVALITTMIVSFITGAYGDPPDFSKIPFWMVFAMDHAMFIGVMTNGLLGLTVGAGERAAFAVAVGRSRHLLGDERGPGRLRRGADAAVRADQAGLRTDHGHGDPDCHHHLSAALARRARDGGGVTACGVRLNPFQSFHVRR